MDWGDLIFIACILVAVILIVPTDYTDYNTKDKKKDDDDGWY